MSLRFWLWACRLAMVSFFLSLAAHIFLEDPWGTILFGIGQTLIIALALMGAVLGIVMVFGNLKMKCPICGDACPVWGDSKTIGVFCDRCGSVSAKLWSGLHFDQDTDYADPSFNWQAESGFVPDVDLARHALGGVRPGDSVGALVKLGRADARNEYGIGYRDRGMRISVNDGTLRNFWVFWKEPLEEELGRFGGRCHAGDKEVALGPETRKEDFVREFGEPFHSHTDDDETILFYEFGEIEWQVEFSLEDTLKAIGVVTPPIFDKPEQRKAYGLTRAWPP